MKDEKTFLEHLEDIRKRVIKSLVAIAILSILAYIFKDKILYILTKPLNQSLIFISPTEPIVMLIKLSIITGVLLAFPYMLFQLWDFIAEVFTKEKKKSIIKYILISILLFYSAIIFCYFIVLPITIKFLIGFGNTILESSLTLQNYLNFALYLLFSFGIVFQFPLILTALIKLEITSVKSLAKKRPHIILIIFIIAAIISPPDAFSQIILALPMILLFEITLIIARFKLN